MNPPPSPLLEADGLEFADLRLPPLCLLEGGSLLVCSPKRGLGSAFIDQLLGITPPGLGHVRLLGTDTTSLSEDALASLLANVAHVGIRGDLVSNLKVWENILLPTLYHRRITAPEAEKLLTATAAAAGIDEDWLIRHLPRLPDTLEPFDQRLASLLRAALQRPRLLVCEFLFDSLTHTHARCLTTLIDCLRQSHPALGILYFHHQPTDDVNLSLTLYDVASTLTLEKADHAVPQKH